MMKVIVDAFHVIFWIVHFVAKGVDAEQIQKFIEDRTNLSMISKDLCK